MSFWATYVIVKERGQNILRAVSLAKIEAKYGIEFRQQVEQELEELGGE